MLRLRIPAVSGAKGARMSTIHLYQTRMASLTLDWHYWYAEYVGRERAGTELPT